MTARARFVSKPGRRFAYNVVLDGTVVGAVINRGGEGAWTVEPVLGLDASVVLDVLEFRRTEAAVRLLAIQGFPEGLAWDLFQSDWNEPEYEHYITDFLTKMKPAS